MLSITWPMLTICDSSRHHLHPQKSKQSFSVSNLFKFPSHPPNMNSSHRREVELKKNRFIAAKQRPVSTGKLQIWAAARQKEMIFCLKYSKCLRWRAPQLTFQIKLLNRLLMYIYINGSDRRYLTFRSVDKPASVDTTEVNAMQMKAISHV